MNGKDLPGVCLASPQMRFQRAAGVGCVPWSLQEGQKVAPQELSVTYLRLPQAERELKKKQAAGQNK